MSMGVLGSVMAMGDPWYSTGVESGNGVDNAIGEGGWDGGLLEGWDLAGGVVVVTSIGEGGTMVMTGGGGVVAVGLPEEGALTSLAFSFGEQRWQRAILLLIAVRASPT